jgi:hypothetical protein
VLVLAAPAGQPFPSGAGYSVAALVSIAVLVATLAESVLFVMTAPVRGNKRA